VFGVLYHYRECGSGANSASSLSVARHTETGDGTPCRRAKLIQALLAGECSRQPWFDTRKDEVLRQLVRVLCYKYRRFVVNWDDDSTTAEALTYFAQPPG
jgi:hypothetical protein